MKRNVGATDYPGGVVPLGGLFEAVPEPVSPGQARLMALYPAGRKMLLWQMYTGWKPCEVVSVRPEGTASCRITVRQGAFEGEVKPCDLKPCHATA